MGTVWQHCFKWYRVGVFLSQCCIFKWNRIIEPSRLEVCCSLASSILLQYHSSNTTALLSWLQQSCSWSAVVQKDQLYVINSSPFSALSDSDVLLLWDRQSLFLVGLLIVRTSVLLVVAYLDFLHGCLVWKSLCVWCKKTYVYIHWRPLTTSLFCSGHNEMGIYEKSIHLPAFLICFLLSLWQVGSCFFAMSCHSP